MTRWLPVLAAALYLSVPVQANGLLIPTDGSIPPLALVTHDVKVKMLEQVATTEVTQVFRNHTDRALEATFVFPVPTGASVNRFSMWVDGKEVKGELVEADKARQIYTDIVRRTQDPGLLEYIGQNLLRVRVFPVPAKGDQKFALRFTSVCNCESGLVEYVYPLKTAEKAAQTLEKFTFNATLTSQRRVHNVYSPTHPIAVQPKGDHQAKVEFEAKKAVLDRDMKLYFSLGKGDVGFTAMTYRADEKKEGQFLFLISPRAELAKSQHVARDFVFVLDVSGSMAGAKMVQAQKAVKHCLGALHANDRFTVLSFATTVAKQSEKLVDASKLHVEAAKKWVDELEATGGTAIDTALSEALDMRPSGKDRPFTVVFFTDGQPTVGETNPEKIVKHVTEKNSTSTRIFTFGVGDDVNAAMLDRLAEITRSASAYVRPEEDIEVKVSGLYGKISHPVMTDLKVSASAGVTLSEMYPKQLPDLFHGGQLVVLGSFKGKGQTALKLTGKVDGETRELVYDVEFPAKTSQEKSFVENLWARRKVGYLLDEIRVHGQNKELVDEVTRLARKHGITTPYTSYLVVPDTVASNTPVPTPVSSTAPTAPGTPAPPGNVDWTQYYKNNGYQITGGGAGCAGGGRIQYAPVYTSPTMTRAVPQGALTGPPPASSAPYGTVPAATTVAPAPTPVLAPADGLHFNRLLDRASLHSETMPTAETPALPQAGKAGVELALQLDDLRTSTREAGKTCQAAGTTCFEVNGVWIDEKFKPGVKPIVVKAQSEAYFKLLAKHPALKDVFRLGNRLVWVTPSGTALVIDVSSGSEKLSDKEIDALFAVKK